MAETIAGTVESSRPEGVVSVYLFGSFAEVRAHRESDLDVGLLLDRDVCPTLRERFEIRLRLTAARKREPAIAAQRIERPIFITGLPRTGTTILHELFMQDPDNRVPLHWEVRLPCPAPEAASYATDPRIPRAEDELQLWNQIVPEYARMHELGARIPVEDIQITPPTFVSDELMGRHIVPSYAAWYASADKSVAFTFHRKFLQHLQSRHACQRWVLKAPSWLGLLPVLFGEYPDARVVITHRDPLKVLPSVVSILYSTAFVRSDAVDAETFKGWFSPETCRALLDGARGSTR